MLFKLFNLISDVQQPEKTFPLCFLKALRLENIVMTDNNTEENVNRNLMVLYSYTSLHTAFICQLTLQIQIID